MTMDACAECAPTGAGFRRAVLVRPRPQTAYVVRPVAQPGKTIRQRARRSRRRPAPAHVPRQPRRASERASSMLPNCSRSTAASPRQPCAPPVSSRCNRGRSDRSCGEPRIIRAVSRPKPITPENGARRGVFPCCEYIRRSQSKREETDDDITSALARGATTAVVRPCVWNACGWEPRGFGAVKAQCDSGWRQGARP
jgi:hypothetical protein